MDAPCAPNTHPPKGNGHTPAPAVKMSRPKQRVLLECFINADDPVYLNHYLKQAISMAEQHSDTIDTPFYWTEFAQGALKAPCGAYRLYALLGWILVLPPFRQYMKQYDNPELFTSFVNVLQAETQRFIQGLRPDGSLYPTDGTSHFHERSVGYFVARMKSIYTDENYSR